MNSCSSERQARLVLESKNEDLATARDTAERARESAIGYSELLQEEAPEIGAPSIVPDLEKIHGAAKHQLALINDILDLAKVEAGKMTLFVEEFDVARLVSEVAATAQPLVSEKGNVLHVDCPADIDTIRTDQTKLR